MTMSDTAEILDRAADILRFEKEWGQGRWEDASGAICGGQAIRLAATERVPAVLRPNTDVALLLGGGCDAWRALHRHVGQDVVHFNDAKGRTKDEVIDALASAAKEIREFGEA